MGQQQLLLVTLGIIIVGIAIFIGFTMFASGKSDANRQAMISDLLNLAKDAQAFYKLPAQLGGGSNNFQGFHLSPLDTGNANGSFSLAIGAAPTGTSYIAGNTTPISSNQSSIYIIGCGKDEGHNNITPVKCFVSVTSTDFQISILN
jgi:hypothetical protein